MDKNDQSRKWERQEGKAGPVESTLQTVAHPLQILLTLPEVARVLSLSRARVYRLLANDRNPDGIPVVRIGRSVRVSVTDLQP